MWTKNHYRKTEFFFKTTRFFAPFRVSAWPKSLLQFDFKNHENVWTDLKKKQPEEFRKRLEVEIWLFSLIRCITSILSIDRQCKQFTKNRLENWKLDKGPNQKIIFSKNPNKILYKKITCSFPSITHRNQLFIYLARSIAHLVIAEKRYTTNYKKD